MHAPFGIRWGWEAGFFEATENRNLEIQNRDSPFPDYQLIRAYALQKKLEWNIGPMLKKYIAHYLPLADEQKLADIYKQRYKSEIEPNILYDNIAYLTR